MMPPQEKVNYVMQLVQTGMMDRDEALDARNFFDGPRNVGTHWITNSPEISETLSWFVPDKMGDHDLKVGAKYYFTIAAITIAIDRRVRNDNLLVRVFRVPWDLLDIGDLVPGIKRFAVVRSRKLKRTIYVVICIAVVRKNMTTTNGMNR